MEYIRSVLKKNKKIDQRTNYVSSKNNINCYYKPKSLDKIISAFKKDEENNLILSKNIDYLSSGYKFRCICCDKTTKLYEILCRHFRVNGDYSLFNVDLHLLLFKNINIHSRYNIFKYLVSTNKYYKKKSYLASYGRKALDVYFNNYTFAEAIGMYGLCINVPFLFNGEYYARYLIRNKISKVSEYYINLIFTNINIVKAYEVLLKPEYGLIYGNGEVYKYYYDLGHRLNYDDYGAKKEENITNTIIYGCVDAKKKAIEYMENNNFKLSNRNVKKCFNLNPNIIILLNRMGYKPKFTCEEIKRLHWHNIAIPIFNSKHRCHNCLDSLDKVKSALGYFKYKNIDAYIEPYIDEITYRDYKKYFINSNLLEQKYNTIKRYLGDIVYYF